MRLLDAIDPQLLYVFVFGPGTGESICIHVPGHGWIVIDSLKANRLPAAQRLIDTLAGDVRLIVLTHPHLDHSSGVIELIDENPSARIGCLHPGNETLFRNGTNDGVLVSGAKAQKTLDRIWTEWESEPARKWETDRGETYHFLDGSLETLHPKLPVPRNGWLTSNLNDLSSAMWLRWNSAEILLGADVSEQWHDVELDYPRLDSHQATKVPHHGSDPAIHVSYGGSQPNRSRFWIVTPFARKDLPDFRTGKGIELSHQFVNKIYLTSMHCRHSEESVVRNLVCRSEVESGSRAFHDPRLDGSAFDAMQRGVAIAFDRNGKIVEERFGAGTLEVSN